MPFATCSLFFSPLQQGADVERKLRSLVDDPVSKDGAEPMRLVVDMNALRRYDPAETMQFIKRPMDYVAAFQEAAVEVCLPQLYRARFASLCLRQLRCVPWFPFLSRESRRVFEMQ